MKKPICAALPMFLICVVLNVGAAEIELSTTATPLLMPAPKDHSPFLPIAETAARSKYQKLFQGKFSGSIMINIDLDIEGRVLGSEVSKYPSGPISEQSLSKAERDALMEVSLHDVYARAGAQGTKFISWHGATGNNGLYLSYRVLKWRIDPLRSVARVQTALAKKFPQFYRPRTLSRANDEPRPTLVTVVMNDDGTIVDARLVESASEEELSDRKMFDRFLAMGLKPENLAYRGRTTNRGDWQEKNLTSPPLMVEYAWRRINDDPPDEVLRSLDVFESVSLSHLRDQQSHPPDEAFLERYFPEVWRDGSGVGDPAVWLLLARNGQVIDKGTTGEADIRSVDEQLQKKYKGIRINEGVSTSVAPKSGPRISLFYTWIAADSQVNPKPAAGIERLQ